MARSERLLALVMAPLLGLGECGGSDTDLGDLEQIECHLGTIDRNGAEVLVAPGDPVELVLGFQGFLYVELVIFSPEAPDRANATMSIAVDGLDPSSGEQPQVRFAAADDGAVTERILLFLTAANLDAYEGHSARIAVRLEGETKGCIVAEDVVLVNELD